MFKLHVKIFQTRNSETFANTTKTVQKINTATVSVVDVPIPVARIPVEKTPNVRCKITKPFASVWLGSSEIPRLDVLQALKIPAIQILAV